MYRQSKIKSEIFTKSQDIQLEKEPKTDFPLLSELTGLAASGTLSTGLKGPQAPNNNMRWSQDIQNPSYRV